MMATRASTIAEPLVLAACLAPGEIEAGIADRRFADALANGASGIPATAWAASRKAFAAALNQTLAIPIGQILKAAALKLNGEMRAESDAVDGFPLPSFVVSSSHHPTITASFQTLHIVLRFDVALSIELNQAALRLEGKRIVGLDLGEAAGAAKLSYLDVDPPLELATLKLDLPRLLSFESPVLRKSNTA